jgi:hypothetical protein
VIGNAARGGSGNACGRAAAGYGEKVRGTTCGQRVWLIFATGALLLAFGAAAFGVALANRDYRRLEQSPRSGVPTAIQESLARRFNRGIDPTPWWAAGTASAAVSVIVLGAGLLAKRRRDAAA